jgi:hypothetical protein
MLTLQLAEWIAATGSASAAPSKARRPIVAHE